MQPLRNPLACTFEPAVFSLIAFVFSITFAPAIYAEEAEETYAVADALFDASRVLNIEIELDPHDWDKLREVSRDLFSSLQADAPAESPFKYVKGDITID